MKQCPGCGTTVLPGWSFCPSCNRDMRILPTAKDLQPQVPVAGAGRPHSDGARRCRNCGHRNPKGADHCEACDYRFTSQSLRLDSPVVIGAISLIAILAFVLLSLPGGLLSGEHSHQLPPSAGIVVSPPAGINTSSAITTTPSSLPLPIGSATPVPVTTLQAPLPVESGAPSIVRQTAVITSIPSSIPETQRQVIPAGLPNASSLPASTNATPTSVASFPQTTGVTPSVTQVSGQVVTIPVPANGHQTGQLTWAGEGNYASEFFTLLPGEVRLSATAEGNPGVIAEIRDRTGMVLGKVSATRSQQDSTMLTVPQNSTYLVAVTGEGSWTVAVVQATQDSRSSSSTPATTANPTPGTGTVSQQGVVTPQLPPTHASLPVG